MCDLRNLCDFLIRESKCFHIVNLSNVCDFAKKNHLKKIGTITCVIGVTCVISLLGSPNDLILIFSRMRDLNIPGVAGAVLQTAL